MAEYFVDTGVFVRWFIEQIGWEHARKVRDEYLQGFVGLVTVDFVRIETANVLRKVGLQGGVFVDTEAYVTAVRAIDDLGIVAHATDVDMLERAARLAATNSLRIFDALIAMHAMDQGMTLLTSDQKLCRAVDGLMSTELLQGIATT
ncbi:type II toxin-antitoxin system VapC family toxin [Kribbella sp. NBC_01245]|uniref:type II toxin-antitoxin system VapC family toxin n=1 Tax=Kribbella sp. NBC_01245 TaxID=2903578 RepID=UPI002E2B9844|nr:type II toxin-antitoxin system VapC family toxin [Kribbella sp. NBC_01245]